MIRRNKLAARSALSSNGTTSSPSVAANSTIPSSISPPSNSTIAGGAPLSQAQVAAVTATAEKTYISDPTGALYGPSTLEATPDPEATTASTPAPTTEASATTTAAVEATSSVTAVAPSPTTEAQASPANTSPKTQPQAMTTPDNYNNNNNANNSPTYQYTSTMTPGTTQGYQAQPATQDVTTKPAGTATDSVTSGATHGTGSASLASSSSASSVGGGSGSGSNDPSSPGGNTPSASDSSSPSTGNSGAVVGGIVGAVILVGLLIYLLLVCRRRRRARYNSLEDDIEPVVREMTENDVHEPQLLAVAPLRTGNGVVRTNEEMRNHERMAIFRAAEGARSSVRLVDDVDQVDAVSPPLAPIVTTPNPNSASASSSSATPPGAVAATAARSPLSDSVGSKTSGRSITVSLPGKYNGGPESPRLLTRKPVPSIAVTNESNLKQSLFEPGHSPTIPGTGSDGSGGEDDDTDSSWLVFDEEMTVVRSS